MLKLLWLVPTLPLAGFILLILAPGRLSKRLSAFIGVGSVVLSALLTVGLSMEFLQSELPGNTYRQILWTWIAIADFTPRIALHLDSLSLVMILVITWVSFLIHLYSTEFMVDETDYQRFFAYMNLFVASMLLLVLADDLLFLYLGWEGVGLCSYLLIGFWYQDPANGYAARKAFLVTRVGDTAMALGLLLLVTHLGTLNIQLLMERASQAWPVGSTLALVAAALLLGGAVGKSAQLPLQTWLPNAMAGPTPVSALIHAATMVTAGVYLIARTHVLFELAPPVHTAVAVIGAFTLLLAACSALVQTDIKRILAYSTMSQIGYMFLALGVGAWSAAIFHFMTHAFFKALLFLSAGVVITSLQHEHNIFKMGGLRRQLPLAFWGFLIGAASLASLPLITAGFYSKDLILWQVWSSPLGGPWLWAAGFIGALLTAVYIFRGWFIAFFGPVKTTVGKKPGILMGIPLLLLSLLSIVGGWVELLPMGGDQPFFSSLLHLTLPELETGYRSPGVELGLQFIVSTVSLLGIVLAYLFFLSKPQWRQTLLEKTPVSALRRFWYVGWGFDGVYHLLLVRPLQWFAHFNRSDFIDAFSRGMGWLLVWPFLWLARVNRDDFIDAFYRGMAWLAQVGHQGLSRTQTGLVRWYTGGIAAGAALLIAMVVFL
ncbi:NADH-quinone oxidoreductase subunit L [Nitrosococcus wardiae]|uniref:NADH-quinone oxidoreductase subunit L n=1 Tax=Nitrosococcus wardiae TaxID=1814290 RepID=A0A4P7C1S5_9GAMM|nr:NADH-quinone oxidoreductase subunit L [Nitrosococcus wardiae]QBQ55580.1 NADH-quinone oxidoreductase subunit L [Nitrosococcus wardiae]